MKDEYFLVGSIVNTHGIKGEVKVKSETNLDRFEKGNMLYLKKGSKYMQIKIDSHRTHKSMELITFNGLTNINDVLEYKGCNLFVKHEDSDTLYYEDLIGKDIVVDGKVVAKVKDIREVPQGIILECEADGKTKFIPYVDAFIKEVADDYIVVTPIEGLL
ncbi:MAG: 16S rRNA processing protein RimM [Bacilli bacterium]|nr:16S rRNA processing protein RimM [Bacilli bacterium]